MLFPISEYMERLHQTKQHMYDQNMDVLLISNPSNMYYLTGYDAWSFYVPQMVVVISDEIQPYWIGREMDAGSAQITTWMDHMHIIPYPDDYVHSMLKHPMDFVANVLKDMGRANRTVGVEMDTHFFTARSYHQLKTGLPNVTLKDATTLVNWIRLIKSDQEIMYMKKAATIVERAMQKGYESIDEGVRECDVAARISHAQVSGTDEWGGDYPAIVPMLPSGKKTSAPHFTWTDKKYRRGDTVILEIAGCYRRYHSPLARTMTVGSPSPKVLELSEVILEGLNETLQAIQPGLTGAEVETVWRKSINKKGYNKRSRLGYSVGLSYPPDWGEHTVSLRQGEQTIIQPNMTFHLIPGMWDADGGVEISESIRITETGCETLAHFPRELYVKDDSGLLDCPVSISE